MAEAFISLNSLPKSTSKSTSRFQSFPRWGFLLPTSGSRHQAGKHVHARTVQLWCLDVGCKSEASFDLGFAVFANIQPIGDVGFPGGFEAILSRSQASFSAPYHARASLPFCFIILGDEPVGLLCSTTRRFHWASE